MSTIGDYKLYKQFAPQYPDWKYSRDLAEAKRQEYIRQNPDTINKKDIQKSKAILRAIDIMDEFSQKRAEDMEVATESLISLGTGIASSIGGFLGCGVYLLAKGTKSLKNVMRGLNKAGPMLVAFYIGGGLLGSLAAIPMYSWGARQEMEASRRGRFEAMRKELDDTRAFAVLTEEQENQLNEIISKTPKKKKNIKDVIKTSDSIDSIKALTSGREEYLAQRMLFEQKLKEDESHFDKELSPEETKQAKQDRQLLTKLIEKIDIASQEYAENAELATTTLTALVFGASALLTLGYEKIAKMLKLKLPMITQVIGFVAMFVAMVYSASIQKEAARVGRFKVKQDLLNHPEKLIYVSDEDTNTITDVKVEQDKKLNMFKFLKEAWKNKKEYDAWKKTEGAMEKETAKALSQIEITDEQMKDARRLQHNTFKTFNKIDENSQKYAESIEALGQSIQYPIETIFSSLGALFGMKYFIKAMEQSAKGQKYGSNMMKYIAIVFLSVLPSIVVNAFITKAQKKASKVADMMAIKELDDYRNFADYSNIDETQKSENAV